MLLKQSTARNRVILMVDSTDHVTGKTGLTLTITASKDAGAFASITPTVTELATGFYKLALTAAHSDTLGDFALHVTGTGADPTDIVDQVVLDLPGIAQTGDNFARLGAPAGASLSADIAGVQADTNDIQTRVPAALVSGRMDSSTGAMAANVLTATAINADAITAAKVADGTIDAATFAAGAINAAAIAADAITDAKVASDVTIASVTGAVGSVTGAVGSVTGDVGGNVVGSVASVTAGVTLAAAAVQAIWDALTSALTTAGSIGKRIADFLTGDAFVRLGAAGAGLTALGDTRIANLDASVSTRLATAGYTAPDNTSIASILVDTAEIGAAGAGLTAIPWNAAWDGEVQSEAADALNAYDPPTSAEMDARTLVAAGYASAANLATVAGYLDTEIGAIKVVTDKVDTAVELDGAVYRFTTNALELAPTGGSAPTVGQIADAVWDEARADHVAAGSFGLASADLDTQIAAVPTATENATQLLGTSVDGSTTVAQSMRLHNSALGAKASGMATATATFRDLADSKNRIVATVDADGNRSAVTLDLAA